MADTSGRNIWDILGGVNAPLVSGVNGVTNNCGTGRVPVCQSPSLAPIEQTLISSKALSSASYGYIDLKIQSTPRVIPSKHDDEILKCDRSSTKRLSQNIFSKLQKKLKLDAAQTNESRTDKLCELNDERLHCGSYTAPLDLSNRLSGDCLTKSNGEKPLNLSVKETWQNTVPVPSFDRLKPVSSPPMDCDSSVAVDSTTVDDDVVSSSMSKPFYSHRINEQSLGNTESPFRSETGRNCTVFEDSAGIAVKESQGSFGKFSVDFLASSSRKPDSSGSNCIVDEQSKLAVKKTAHGLLRELEVPALPCSTLYRGGEQNSLKTQYQKEKYAQQNLVFDSQVLFSDAGSVNSLTAGRRGHSASAAVKSSANKMNGPSVSLNKSHTCCSPAQIQSTNVSSQRLPVQVQPQSTVASSQRLHAQVQPQSSVASSQRLPVQVQPQSTVASSQRLHAQVQPQSSVASSQRLPVQVQPQSTVASSQRLHAQVQPQSTAVSSHRLPAHVQSKTTAVSPQRLPAQVQTQSTVVSFPHLPVHAQSHSTDVSCQRVHVHAKSKSAGMLSQGLPLQVQSQSTGVSSQHDFKEHRLSEQLRTHVTSNHNTATSLGPKGLTPEVSYGVHNSSVGITGEMASPLVSSKHTSKHSISPASHCQLGIQIGSLRHMSSSSRSPSEAVTADTLSVPRQVSSPLALNTQLVSNAVTLISTEGSSHANNDLADKCLPPFNVSSTTRSSEVENRPSVHKQAGNQSVGSSVPVQSIKTKHSAFEIMNSFNEKFLSDIRTSSFTLAAFNRNLFATNNREFKDSIVETPYYKSIERNAVTANETDGLYSDSSSSLVAELHYDRPKTPEVHSNSIWSQSGVLNTNTPSKHHLKSKDCGDVDESHRSIPTLSPFKKHPSRDEQQAIQQSSVYKTRHCKMTESGNVVDTRANSAFEQLCSRTSLWSAMTNDGKQGILDNSEDLTSLSVSDLERCDKEKAGDDLYISVDRVDSCGAQTPRSHLLQGDLKGRTVLQSSTKGKSGSQPNVSPQSNTVLQSSLMSISGSQPHDSPQGNTVLQSSTKSMSGSQPHDSPKGSTVVQSNINGPSGSQPHVSLQNRTVLQTSTENEYNSDIKRGKKVASSPESLKDGNKNRTVLQTSTENEYNSDIKRGKKVASSPESLKDGNKNRTVLQTSTEDEYNSEIKHGNKVASSPESLKDGNKNQTVLQTSTKSKYSSDIKRGKKVASSPQSLKDGDKKKEACRQKLDSAEITKCRRSPVKISQNLKPSRVGDDNEAPVNPRKIDKTPSNVEKGPKNGVKSASSRVSNTEQGVPNKEKLPPKKVDTRVDLKDEKVKLGVSDTEDQSTDYHSDLSTLEDSVNNNHSTPRRRKRICKKSGILSEIANSDGFVADKLTKKSESKDLFVEPSKLNREERAIQMALMRITRMEVKAALKTQRSHRGLAAPCKLDSFENNSVETFSQTSDSESAETSSKPSQRDATGSNNMTSQTSWARRCVKKHTRRCQGHFRAFRYGSKDEKEESVQVSPVEADDHAGHQSRGTTRSSSSMHLSVNTDSPMRKCSPRASPYRGERANTVENATSSSWLKMNIPDYVKKLMVYHATGETVLHRASRLGYKDVVKWCCQTGFVNINARDHAGYTPLHESCIGGHVAIAQCLIEYNADVNAASRLDGARPLHDAVETGNVELVRLLLASGADITLVTYSEKTVFSLAQSLEMKEFLHAYLYDINGGQHCDGGSDWRFEPSWSDLCDEDNGFDVLADAPSDDASFNCCNIIFECSHQPFLPIFFLQLDGQRQVSEMSSFSKTVGRCCEAETCDHVMAGVWLMHPVALQTTTRWFPAVPMGDLKIALLRRPDNYLLLEHVLKRVGLTHEEFLAAHQDEVVVHEVNERLLQPHVSGPVSESNDSTEGRRVELVRMCDIVRRLLNIEVVAVAGQRCPSVNF